VEAFPMGGYYFLSRIVMFYNDFGRSQYDWLMSAHVPDAAQRETLLRRAGTYADGPRTSSAP
jgi:hypothetical protein